MKKKLFMTLAVIFSILLVLSACGGKSPSASAPSGGNQQPATQAPAQSSPAPGSPAQSTQSDAGAATANDTKKVEFPTKPIKMIVYSNTGGGIDLITRQLSKSLEEVKAFPVPTFVENMPGAGGTVAMEYLSKVNPDGYEIMVASNSLTTQPILLKFDKNLMDFKPIINLGVEPLFVTVRSDSPFNSLEDLLNYQGVLNIGGPSKGTMDHITWMRLAEMTGMKINYIPYKSGGDAVTALVGGDTQAMFSNAAESKPLLEAGRVKWLASTGRERYDHPEIPTLLDLGYNITQEQFRGFVTHKDVPDEIVKILHDGIKKAYDESDSMKEYLQSNSIARGYMDGEQFRIYIAEEIQKMEKYLVELGIVE